MSKDKIIKGQPEDPNPYSDSGDLAIIGVGTPMIDIQRSFMHKPIMVNIPVPDSKLSDIKFKLKANNPELIQKIWPPHSTKDHCLKHDPPIIDLLKKDKEDE